MNIFFLHSDPVSAVKPMYNKHVVKMILETAQILCTNHHLLGDGDSVPYKPTHKNHPSTVWARENTANYDWLYLHFIALCDEYTQRYGKTHLTFTKCAEALYNAPSGIPHSDGVTDMPQCMDDQYKVQGDSVQAYRNYYILGKREIANANETVIDSIYGYSPKKIIA